MELFDAIKGRRSIRSYKDKPIDINTIMEIMETAVWAPSASNLQPWHFTVVLDIDIIKRVRSFSPGMFNENPPCIIVISLNKSIIKEQGEDMGSDNVFDLAMAAQNIMLSAYSLGIGSCIKLSFNKDAVKKILKLKDDVEPKFVITMGYPNETPEPPERRDIKEVLDFV